MPKLKEGEKVCQEFLVTLKFRALAGDTRFKAKDVKDCLIASQPEDGAVTFIVRELKKDPAIA